MLKAIGKEPSALRNRPVLKEGLGLYLKAFHELRTDRQIGMGIGPIPWSSIDRWARRHEINDIEDFDTFVEHIRAMEVALNKHENKGKDAKI